MLGPDAEVSLNQRAFVGRFFGLADYEADVIAAGVTHTMQRQVSEVSARQCYWHRSIGSFGRLTLLLLWCTIANHRAGICVLCALHL